MRADYIRAAMKHAQIEQLPDGHWYGRIPLLGEIWVTAPTLDACEAALQQAVGDWLTHRTTAHLPIPLIDGLRPD